MLCLWELNSRASARFTCVCVNGCPDRPPSSSDRPLPRPPVPPRMSLFISHFQLSLFFSLLEGVLVELWPQFKRMVHVWASLGSFSVGLSTERRSTMKHLEMSREGTTKDPQFRPHSSHPPTHVGHKLVHDVRTTVTPKLCFLSIQVPQSQN